MYSETVIDHFRSPRNSGPMRAPDAVGEGEDPMCGDLTRFYLRVDQGRVVEARFQTYGCGPSIAASSLATELVRGRPVAALAAVTADEIEAALGGLPADRRHAATLAAQALHAAARGFQDSVSREGHHA